MATNFIFSFFFKDTATSEIYTLSLHDALPICRWRRARRGCAGARRRSDRRSAPSGPGVLRRDRRTGRRPARRPPGLRLRSVEHTSEFQARQYLVWRLLLELIMIIA